MTTKASNAGRVVTVEQADETTGAVVYWHLSEDAVGHMPLRAEWARHGLDAKLLPTPASAEVAFGRACRELAERNILVRKNPAGGWTVVHEKVVNGELAYVPALKLRLREGAIVPEAMDGVTTGDIAEVGPKVQAAYDNQRVNMISVDASQWLRRLVGEMDGVPLRATGGIYFVPRHYMDLLHKVKDALGAVTRYTVHEIPAVHSADTIAAVLDALRTEVSAWVSEVDGELAGGNLGPRAARTRVDACDALTTKVATYERLFASSMGVVDTLKAIRAKLLTVTSRGANLEVDTTPAAPTTAIDSAAALTGGLAGRLEID